VFDLVSELSYVRYRVHHAISRFKHLELFPEEGFCVVVCLEILFLR
jgi:hypothetical protein